MWESQALLTDGQVFFPRAVWFSPTFDERSARYKWNILARAVKPKSKKKIKKSLYKNICYGYSLEEPRRVPIIYVNMQKYKKHQYFSVEKSSLSGAMIMLHCFVSSDSGAVITLCKYAGCSGLCYYRIYPKYSDTSAPYHICSNIWTSIIHYPMLCLKIAGWVANSVDPDETPHSAASHLGLNCLLRPVCPNTYGKYGSLFFLGEFQDTYLLDWVGIVLNWRDIQTY